MEFPIETADPILVDLLNNECKNPVYINLKGVKFRREGEEGFASYRVELHCVAITYVAKVLERGTDGLPTKYLVDSLEYEDC